MNLKFEQDLMEGAVSALCSISWVDGLGGPAGGFTSKMGTQMAGKLVLAAS